jgi:aerobic C4-dicarboxylate transport protein
LKKALSNLTLQVLAAIIIGILVGHFYPETGKKMEIIGKTFVEIIKLFIYPIIFITIVLGISSMGDMKKVGRIGGKALLYFELVTTLALVIGILVANIIRPGDGVDTSQLKSDPTKVAEYMQKSGNMSMLQFLKDNLTLQVLITAIAVGILLNYAKFRPAAIKILNTSSKYVFWALGLVMRLAPIAAFGGMAFVIGKFGLHTLIPLGKLLITVYCTMALFIFIVLNAIMHYSGFSLWRFLGYIKQEILVVLGTSSSEAALPAMMEKLEAMGCSKSVVGLVIPTGYSFNLDGTTIYLSMATIFLSQVFKIQLSYEQMLTIFGILMITSKGAAGVTGSGFIVLASTLTAVKVIPLEGLAFLFGIDKFMSEARAITNVIGNGVATIVLAKNEKEFDFSKLEPAYKSIQTL